MDDPALAYKVSQIQKNLEKVHKQENEGAAADIQDDKPKTKDIDRQVYRVFRRKEMNR